MIYADYAFYKTVYRGAAISESDFAALAVKASDYIDYITREKANRCDERVKKACCALAETYQIIDNARANALHGEKQSESVGSWSVTYRSTADGAADAEKTLYSIAQRYLANYMYRGGRC